MKDCLAEINTDRVAAMGCLAKHQYEPVMMLGQIASDCRIRERPSFVERSFRCPRCLRQKRMRHTLYECQHFDEPTIFLNLILDRTIQNI
jgi:hypothetical protein